MTRRSHLNVLYLNLGISLGLAIALVPTVQRAVLALPPAPTSADTIASPPLNLPVCYFQIQGGAAIDVSRICGKKPSNVDSKKSPTPTLTIAPINTPGSTPPPPDLSGAATAKQCNFVDANGKPCPKKDAPPTPTDAVKPNAEVAK
jgi:hypothetical protein